MANTNGGRHRNKNLMNRCALAVASGSSVGQWAREAEIPPRTAYGWSQTDEFKKLVAKHRDRIVDRAIGVLTKNATAAVTAIARLIKEGENDAVRLNAAKSLLDKLMEVQTHASTMRTLSEMGDRIKLLEQATNATGTPD